MIKNRNQGLTLIEVIVTVAIIAVFGTVIATYVLTTTNFYRGSYHNSKVQMDAQEILDELENRVIDVNHSIYYARGSATGKVAPGAEIGNDLASPVQEDKTLILGNVRESGGTSSGSSVRKARLVNSSRKNYIYDIIDWRKDSQSLYYIQKQSSGEPTQTETATLMSENVTAFSVDTSKVESDHEIRFQITMNVKGKEVTNLRTVTLRNRPQILALGEGIIEDTPDPEEPDTPNPKVEPEEPAEPDPVVEPETPKKDQTETELGIYFYNQTENMIVLGGQYFTCSFYNHEGFFFTADAIEKDNSGKHVLWNNGNTKIEWKITDATSQTGFKKQDQWMGQKVSMGISEEAPQLYVQPYEKGFKLSLSVTVDIGDNNWQAVDRKTYTAEIWCRVVNEMRIRLFDSDNNEIFGNQLNPNTSYRVQEELVYYEPVYVKKRNKTQISYEEHILDRSQYKVTWSQSGFGFTSEQLDFTTPNNAYSYEINIVGRPEQILGRYVTTPDAVKVEKKYKVVP